MQFEAVCVQRTLTVRFTRGVLATRTSTGKERSQVSEGKVVCTLRKKVEKWLPVRRDNGVQPTGLRWQRGSQVRTPELQMKIRVRVCQLGQAV